MKKDWENKMHPTVELKIKLSVNTMRQDDGTFIQGSPQFTTTASKELVKHLLDKEITMPTVSCSRSIGGCNYGINNLEAHNYHVPMFEIESEMLTYCERIVRDISQECNKIEVKLVMDDASDTDASVLVGQENIGTNCSDCNKATTEGDIVGANEQGYPLCTNCYENYMKETHDGNI